MSRVRAVVGGITITGLFLAFLPACSSPDPQAESPSNTQMENPSDPPSSDGILKIGLVVPLSDPRSTFGPDLVSIVKAVIELMNGFGGYDGNDIEFSTIDENAIAEKSGTTVDWSVFEDLDAFIGPFSASGSMVIVPQLISRGKVVCSPSLASISFDQIDDDGLFFRTSTLESEIMSGMVDIAVQTGSQQVAVVFPDDPYGRRLLSELKGVLSARDLEITSQVPYSPLESNLQSVVDAIVDDSSDVALLVGEPVGAPKILDALRDRAEPGIIILNDALANSKLEIPPSVEPSGRPRILGVAADLRRGDAKLLNDFSFGSSNFLRELKQIAPFGVNTVECLTITWLAARSAGSDDAEIFKDRFIDISKDGSRCTWIFDCSFLLDQSLNLDYEGSTSLTLDSLGNGINRGTLIFTFDEEGLVVPWEGPLNLTPSEPILDAPLS